MSITIETYYLQIEDASNRNGAWPGNLYEHFHLEAQGEIREAGDKIGDGGLTAEILDAHHSISK
jgi:hypothetical protein